MKIKTRGMCRGDGKGYVRLVIEGSAGCALEVDTALDNGSPAPSLWIEDHDLPDCQDRAGTLVFPLFDSAAIVIRASLRADARPLCSIRLSAMKLKWLSRLNYRLRSSLCAGLRGIDEREADRLRVSLVWCIPDGEESVWRISADSPSTDSRIVFSAWDGLGERISVDPIFFEDQCFSEGSVDGIRRRVVVSLRVTQRVNSLFVIAEDETGNARMGMLGFERGTFSGALRRACWRVRTAADTEDYRRWTKGLGVPLEGSQEDGKCACEPLISIVVPCCRVHESSLREMLDSVIAQGYRTWELMLVGSESAISRISHIVDHVNDDRITVLLSDDTQDIVAKTNVGIEEAHGDYLAFLDCDDVLEPNALQEYVAAINECPNVGLLYCDEDSFEVFGTFRDPIFKSDFNRDLLYTHNYIAHWLMVSRVVLDEIVTLDPNVGGSHGYDLALRVSETSYEIMHVPHMLYHARVRDRQTIEDDLNSKTRTHEAGRTALQEHFSRRGLSVRVEDGDRSLVYRVRYDLPEPEPSIEILIPSKDHTDVLDRCVGSILERSTYRNYRITVIENNSVEDETFAYYRELEDRDSRVRVIKWPYEFNYAKILNYGAAQSNAELLLLLNNDTEAITADFLEEMAGYLLRPEVGVVGAKLLYYDGLVQHAGMLIGPDGTVVHVNQNVPDSWRGYLDRSVRPSNFSSVTGACQMVRRSVYEEVGGYSEEFAVGYNDADFCCKVSAAGYSVVLTPYAKMFHNEFVSRGREEGDASKMARWRSERTRMQEKWPLYFEQGDPFSNPNLDRNSLYFALPSSENRL